MTLSSVWCLYLQCSVCICSVEGIVKKLGNFCKVSIQKCVSGDSGQVWFLDITFPTTLPHPETDFH